MNYGLESSDSAQHAPPGDKRRADAETLPGDVCEMGRRNAVEALVERNLPLVKYVLSKVSRNLPPHVDRDDLLAAGLLGLTEAARRFDPARNVPFHSYAIPRIWGAMLDELRSHDWLPARPARRA